MKLCASSGVSTRTLAGSSMPRSCAWARPRIFADLARLIKKPSFFRRTLSRKISSWNRMLSRVCKMTERLLDQNPSHTKTVRSLPCCILREAPCFFLSRDVVESSPKPAAHMTAPSSLWVGTFSLCNFALHATRLGKCPHQSRSNSGDFRVVFWVVLFEHGMTAFRCDFKMLMGLDRPSLLATRGPVAAAAGAPA